MPLDAIFLSGLTKELKEKLTGTRIDKVFQPERDEIILATRAGRLLISVGSSPRIHLTGESRENPSAPPMFCMLLRKHIVPAKITDIRQQGLERALDIILDVADEMGERSVKTLTVELIGRQANIILRDSENRIIDCLRRVGSDITDKHPLLSGLFYKPPEAPPDKLNPTDFSEAELYGLLERHPDQKAEKTLCSACFGMSPFVCRELIWRACGDASATALEMPDKARAALWRELRALMDMAAYGGLTPVILEKDGEPFDFYCLPSGQYGSGTCRNAKDFSLLLEEFFTVRDRTLRMKRRASEIIKRVTTIKERTARKLAIQTEELKAVENRDRLRQLGDLLTTNLHAIRPGQARITVQDYYDDCREIDIQLDIRLSPQQNAAKFYKEFNKMKNAEKYLAGQMELARSELEYLESVLEELDRAERPSELAEITEELIQSGYIKKSGRGKTKTESRPMEFISVENIRIFAGRNNRQNDELTGRLADRRDIWLHTQKIPGCHVIIDCGGEAPGDATITEAAIIAAYYSKAKLSKHVPVDYTQVKYVKKPPGAKPGMVIYDKFKTAIVTPDPAIVEMLKKQRG